MLDHEYPTGIKCLDCNQFVTYFEPSDAKGFFYCYRCQKEIIPKNDVTIMEKEHEMIQESKEWIHRQKGELIADLKYLIGLLEDEHDTSKFFFKRVLYLVKRWEGEMKRDENEIHAPIDENKEESPKEKKRPPKWVLILISILYLLIALCVTWHPVGWY